MPTFISLGQYCRPAMNLRRRGAHVIFPFDVISSPDVKTLRDCIAADLDGFMDFTQYQKLAEGHWRQMRYGLDFYHDSLGDQAHFIRLYTPRIENLRNAIKGPVVFVRESAPLEDFEALLDIVPNSRGILVNHTDTNFRLHRTTDRVREWLIPGDTASVGDYWPHESWMWDIILESGEWP